MASPNSAPVVAAERMAVLGILNTAFDRQDLLKSRLHNRPMLLFDLTKLSSSNKLIRGAYPTKAPLAHRDPSREFRTRIFLIE